jgi:hypothetical protein
MFGDPSANFFWMNSRSIMMWALIQNVHSAIPHMTPALFVFLNVFIVENICSVTGAALKGMLALHSIF